MSVLKRRQKVVQSTIESLEARRLLHATILDALPDQDIAFGSAAQTIDLTSRYSNPDFDPSNFGGTHVVFDTTLGKIKVTLKDSIVPGIVTNFLKYLDNDLYNDTIIHRSSSLSGDGQGGFALTPVQVLQGGGFRIAEGPTFAQVTAFNDVVQDTNVAGNNNILGSLAAANTGAANSTGSGWFFNVTDNTSSIGNNYNVFGQIDAGTDVMNAIAALQRVSGGSGLSALPVTSPQGQQATFNDLVYIKSILRDRGYSLTVSSSNTNVVSASLNGRKLNLIPGTTIGSATVSVTITSDDGHAITDEFQYSNAIKVGVGGSKLVRFTDSNNILTTVSLNRGTGSLSFSGTGLAASTVRGVTTVTGTNLVIDSIGLSGASLGTLAVKSTGATTIGSINSSEGVAVISAPRATLSGTSTINGDVRTFAVAGVNTLQVNGNLRALVTANSATGITVTGLLTSAKVGQINNFTAGSSVVLAATNINGNVTINGDSTTLVSRSIEGAIQITGNSRVVKVTNNITGAISIGGNSVAFIAGSIGSTFTVTGAARVVTIGSASGTSFNIGGANVARAALVLTVLTANDINLTSAIPVRLIRTNGWNNTDSTDDTITAPSITSLVSAGGFNSVLSLNNSFGVPRTLNAAVVRGELSAGAWNVTGNVGSIVAASINSNWSASVSGLLNVLKVTGDLSSDITAGAITSLVVGGDLLASNLTLTNALEARGFALRVLAVRGDIISSVVKATHGNIAKVVATIMANSKILAGMNVETLPDDASDFSDQATISTVAIKRAAVGATSFSNSLIAAANVKVASVGTVQPDNSGNAFGVGGNVVTRVVGFIGSTVFNYPRITPQNPGDFEIFNLSAAI